jgi:hypothetical protein
VVRAEGETEAAVRERLRRRAAKSGPKVELACGVRTGGWVTI